MTRDSTTGNLAYWKRVILWRNRPTGIRKAQGMRKQEEGIPMGEQAYRSMEGPRNERTGV
jgi:hypothetical protein